MGCGGSVGYYGLGISILRLRTSNMNSRSTFLLSMLIALSCSQAEADFIIDVNVDAVDQQYRAAFTNAANTWETLVNGYFDGRIAATTGDSSYNIGETIDTLFITADTFSQAPGGLLGFAGPTQAVRDESGFWLASDGEMSFDTFDLDDLVSEGLFEAVILHEMAHVMGFGTLWELNDVYVSGSGKYDGINGNSFWETEFGQVGERADVELQGGDGTANGHWNENFEGSGATGITDLLGRDMRDELMTGWLNPNPFVSNMTLGSFEDIGFTVNYQAVPEPSSALLVGFGVAFLGVRCRKKRSLL